MKPAWTLLMLSLLVVLARAGHAAPDQEGLQEPPNALGLHLADYDAEPRLSNGRVDVQQLAARLKQLGATTYYFLILHAATDWEDLKLFLPVAARNYLAVWVYLVPPSESPPRLGTRYSEPFRLDFPRWAEEIAKLSLQHTNLTGWVIDDFFANHELFTPAYVQAMQQCAKQINPRLRFLPLMYFNEVRLPFAEDYHGVIDGAVVAYPPDAMEIKRAWAVLNDAPGARGAEFSFPGGTPSKPGDFASASQRAQVNSGDGAVIRFRERKDYSGPASGYHFRQMLVNGSVVWEEDVAGGDKGWREVTVQLPGAAMPGAEAEITFRLLDKKGVRNFAVRWELADLRTQGWTLAASLAEPQKWQLKRQGAFEAGFGEDATRERGRWHLPFVVMTAGQTVEFRLRHGEPASPERIAAWLAMSVQSLSQGKCDGVVTYSLDKGKHSRVFDLARDVFEHYRRGGM